MIELIYPSSSGVACKALLYIGIKPVKKQNLENFFPRRKRTGHYEIFSFGSGFALFMEPTQQAAGYSASQNKIEVSRLQFVIISLSEPNLVFKSTRFYEDKLLKATEYDDSEGEHAFFPQTDFAIALHAPLSRLFLDF